MKENQEDLIKAINSPSFDLLSCIDYLRRYSTDIGIQFYLTKKLKTFKYEDIEFLIPQFLQILVSFETTSMAVEEFIMEYSEEYPHFSLIVFWNLQAFVFELKDNPNSYSFQMVRSLVNKLQDILFNAEANTLRLEFRENLQPALVLCGALAASFGVPLIHDYAKPIIEAQARQQKSFVFRLANFQKSLTRNLTLKNRKLSAESRAVHSDDEKATPTTKKSINQERHSESSTRIKRLSMQTLASDESEFYTSDEDEQPSKSIRRKSSLNESGSRNSESISFMHNIESRLDVNSVLKKKGDQIKRILDQQHQSYSMPDLRSSNLSGSIRPALTTAVSEITFDTYSDGEPHENDDNHTEKVDPERLLKINYSKKVTEFILALQNVSLRLSQLPKEARLSALRAELSIINETLLPSEVDIPQLLPVTSTKKKFHKILKLSVNEACVLNSAERVPFLIFVEFLSDELDFDPSSLQNKRILENRTKQHKKGYPVSKNTMERSQVTDEQQDMASALFQVETDLSDLKVVSKDNSSYDLTNFNSGFEFIGKRPDKTRGQIDVNAKDKADQMRIAAVMLQQLESSGQATSEQSSAIKERIVKSMIDLQDQFESIDYDKYNELKGTDDNAGERKLENDFKLAEDWKAKKQRIRNASVYGHLPNWDLCSVIAKNGSDLPQEAFACQLIALISNIWTKKNIPSWTKRMKILITSANTGLVETITNAISIHSVKKSLTEISIAEGENTKRRIFTLKDYFEKIFNGSQSSTYKRAQENFARSLASYSIICYILQIKDRHNGNIMLDNEGHIIHIDFGFLLSNSPGSVGFEAAPFKLTMEYVDLLGGLESELFLYFKDICKKCFLALREHSEQIINMVEIMQKDSSLPCFNNGESTSVLLKQRLQLQLNEEEACDFVETVLIGKSLGSMYTRLYDQFQLITQGIYS